MYSTWFVNNTKSSVCFEMPITYGGDLPHEEEKSGVIKALAAAKRAGENALFRRIEGVGTTGARRLV
jgi:hypothetical protein